jgi:hypothetical protein
MNFAETLVFVAAGSPATLPVRSGCTKILLSEDRELQPHPILSSPSHCGAEKRRCQVEGPRCQRGRSGCHAAALACC